MHHSGAKNCFFVHCAIFVDFVCFVVQKNYNLFPKNLHAASALFTPSSWNP